MYERIERAGSRAHGFAIIDPLGGDEAEALRKTLEASIRSEGKIRVLFELRSQPYGDFKALWEDLKFQVKHIGDLERVAVVGDRRWEKAAVRVFDTFTSAQCRYFERGHEDLAWSWVES